MKNNEGDEEIEYCSENIVQMVTKEDDRKKDLVEGREKRNND